MSQVPIRYRNCKVWYWPPPIPTRAWDWHWQHDDHQGETTGCGDAPSLEACKLDIDEWYEEQEAEAQWGTACGPGCGWCGACS